MRKFTFSFKSLLVAAGLLIGSANAWGDEILIDNVDFENTETYTSGWTFPNGNINTYQNLYDTEDPSSGHYLEMINTRNGANRTGYFTFSNKTLTSAEKWRLEFDFGLASESASGGNSQNMRITCASGDVLTVTNAKNSTSATVTSTLSPSDALCTLTIPIVSSNEIVRYSAVPAFHFIVECKSDGVYATITSLDKLTTHLSETKIANATTLSKINFQSDKYYSNQGFDNIKTWVIIDADVVSDPSVAITEVSGTKRTVTITPGSSLLDKSVTTYYTTDGEDPTTSSSVYSSPLTISGSCTVKAVTISAESVSSNVISLAVSAGTEVQLAAPSVAVTSMVTNGSYYTPHYSISYDNSDVLLNPTSTLAATFNGTPVDISSGTFEPSVQGTFVVTATCEGYKSNTTEVTMKPLYEIKHESPNFDGIALANIATTLGVGTWNASAGSGRWSNWSKTGGVNADLSANNGADYYYATVDANFTYNSWLNVSIGDAFQYLAGFGFGSNDKNKAVTCSITGAEANSIAVYTYCRNDWASTDYKDGTVSYTIPTSYALKKVIYYAPVPATISTTIGATGYTTFASPYALNLSSMTASEGDVTAYVASSQDGTKVTLTAAPDDVKAGEGLVLNGTVGATITIPVIASSDNDPTNLLVGCPTATDITAEMIATTTKYYVVANNGGTAQFQYLTSALTIPAGKAYLPVATGGGVKALSIVVDGTATGIEAAPAVEEAEEEGVLYNTAGQAVTNDYKGIVIKNGKKYYQK